MANQGIGLSGSGGGTLPYTSYVAALSQSGTSAPTATVIYNNLGGTVVWARTDVGEYTATLANAFTADKTFVSQVMPSSGFLNNNSIASRLSASVITLSTGSSDNELAADKSFIEIRVYT